MGDISEMRGLVVVLTFMCVFIALIAWMPSNLYAASYATRLNQTGQVEGGTYMAWNLTHISNLTAATGSPEYDQFTIGGYLTELVRFANYDFADGGISYQTYQEILGFKYNRVDFKWYHDGAEKSNEYNLGSMIAPDIRTVLLIDTVQDTFDGSSESLGYTIVNTYMTLTVQFEYDTGTYTNPRDAFDADALSLIFNVSWDSVATNINAWTLVSGILFFNIPTVHPWLNYLISVPVWICLCYLIYIFLLRTIGALFGGGA